MTNIAIFILGTGVVSILFGAMVWKRFIRENTENKKRRGQIWTIRESQQSNLGKLGAQAFPLCLLPHRLFQVLLEEGQFNLCLLAKD